MAKLKQFGLTHYYRGMELEVMAVTSSKKKFADLVGTSPHYVSQYAHSFDPRTKECIEKPEVLFAKAGIGGEICYVFDREKVLPYSEYKTLIDEHRLTYSNYRDYVAKNKLE